MSEQQQEIEQGHEVRIHIDEQRYESPNPTTGEALYLLGKVAPGSDLYREVEGNREDQPVWDGGEIHLAEDEHFTLIQGEHVKVKNGTVFNVTATNKS